MTSSSITKRSVPQLHSDKFNHNFKKNDGTVLPWKRIFWLGKYKYILISSFMLINGSATKRGFFIMPIVKSSVWMRELLVKANLSY